MVLPELLGGVFAGDALEDYVRVSCLSTRVRLEDEDVLFLPPGGEKVLAIK